MSTRPDLTALTDRRRQRLLTCVHEAGHAVASVVLGGRISKVVVFPTRTAMSCGGRPTEILGETTHSEVPAGSWPMITYAGPWAEASFLAGGQPTAPDLLHILNTTGHLDDKALCASDGHREGALIVPLLERCWPAMSEVAKKLLSSAEVTHNDVCTALGLTDEGGLGSFQLALIRSGDTPHTLTTAGTP